MPENKINRSRTLKFDPHIHSNYSLDSHVTIKKIVDRAIKIGLDGIAICDHNTIKGSKRAIEYVEKSNLPLIVIPGIEVSTLEGHLLILGIRENIPPNLTAKETIRIAKSTAEKNGNTIVTIAAHPFKKSGVGDIEGLEIDAVETFNSRCISGENEKAKKMARRLKKGETGGSDSHLLRTIGLGVTVIETNSNTDEESILKAIKENKTVSDGEIVPLYIILFQAIRKIASKLSRKFRK